MSRLTELALLLAIAVLIVGIIACDQLIGILTEKELSQTVPAPPQLTVMSGELSIGLLYPMTGRLAMTGAQMKQGFDLAVEEINHAQLGGATINCISVDDRSTVAGAVEGFNQLIRQTEVPAIIGPTTSSQCEAAFPIAQASGIAAFSPTSAATGLSAIGDFIFRVTLTSDAHIPNSVRVTKEKLDYKHAALIYDELHAIRPELAPTPFGKALTENGVEIVADGNLPDG